MFVTSRGKPRGQRLPLWNGRDFQGWQRAGRGVWSIAEGALVGHFDWGRPGPGYLLTIREFQNFVLELEFWISRGGNSGVYVREPTRAWGYQGDARPGHGPGSGYEIQIDYQSTRNPTGSIYGIQPARRVVGAEERWNKMQIECNGPRIRVWIDNILVNDFSPARIQPGVIGLQVHGGRPHYHVVKFRELYVTEL